MVCVVSTRCPGMWVAVNLRVIIMRVVMQPVRQHAHCADSKHAGGEIESPRLHAGTVEDAARSKRCVVVVSLEQRWR
jgi:hypothetical protein